MISGMGNAEWEMRRAPFKRAVDGVSAVRAWGHGRPACAGAGTAAGIDLQTGGTPVPPDSSDSGRPRHSAFRISPFPLSASRAAFTLFEVILALAILGILTGAVYSITFSALETSKATLAEQASGRRLEAFLRVTRDAFLGLPREGKVQLRFSRSASGAPVPEVIFEEAVGVFGIPSLGGGSLILAARPQADGTRTMSMLRIPKGVQGIELDRLTSKGAWIPLLPRVERVKWSFFADGQWRDEWQPESGRPLAARLQMEYLDMAGSKISADFWIPPLAAQAAGNAQPTPAPAPAPNE